MKNRVFGIIPPSCVYPMWSVCHYLAVTEPNAAERGNQQRSFIVLRPVPPSSVPVRDAIESNWAKDLCSFLFVLFRKKLKTWKNNGVLR